MDYKSVVSSNIESIGYDAEQRILAVKYRSGGEYWYDGIDAETYRALMGSASKGTFVHSVIKNKSTGSRRI